MTPENWVGVVAAILGSGVLGSLLTGWFSRRQRRAETASLLALVDKTEAETEHIEVDSFQQVVDMSLALARGLREHMAMLEVALEGEKDARRALEGVLNATQVRMNELEAMYERERVSRVALEAELEAERAARCALQRRLDALEARYRRLLSGVRVLIGQVRDLGEEPAFVPDVDEGD